MFSKKSEPPYRLINKSVCALNFDDVSPFYSLPTGFRHLAQMACVSLSVKWGSFLICQIRSDWNSKTQEARSTLGFYSRRFHSLQPAWSEEGDRGRLYLRDPGPGPLSTQQLPPPPQGTRSGQERKGSSARAGPCVWFNLLTSVCSAAPTTPQQTKARASRRPCQRLQIGNRPTLFALGQKEGANSSFCKSSWLYSSLN